MSRPSRKGLGSQGRFCLQRKQAGWVVINDDGSGLVAGPFVTRAAADEAREEAYAARRSGVRVRPCMCCETPFPSEGAHNRLCDPCRKRGAEPYNGAVSYIDWHGGAVGVRHG
jgi:hypothetical protein